MISMTTWTHIITYHLESKQTRTSISEAMKELCLLSPKKIFNTYQVDSLKVWENIILRDPDCIRRLQELGIRNVLELESYYHSFEERVMWRSYRSSYKKAKR